MNPADFGGLGRSQIRDSNFTIGDVSVDVASRRIAGPLGRVAIEPRIMQVLTVLANDSGRLVSREELLRKCWHGLPVGDDSLNRTISVLRRALRSVAGDGLSIETVAGTGYILVDARKPDSSAAKAVDHDAAIRAGWDYWKSGSPRVDLGVIEQLRRAATRHADSVRLRAMLALALRQAAEYAELEDCAAFVRDCEHEAKAALALDSASDAARAALIGLVPIFGDWTPRRERLLALLAQSDNNIAARDMGDIVARHELAILEMATGCVRAAVRLVSDLLEREPLAATLHYKRVYHCWSIGELGEMDRVADRAIQLWPRHPAIWFARLWTLAFTGRAQAGLQQLSEEPARPPIPPPALATIETTLRALAEPDSGSLRSEAIEQNLRAAARGPAQSVAATMHLSALGEVDGALRCAEGYLLRGGPISVSIHKSASDPSVTDQHRRVTQMLFVPVTAPLRAHPGFVRLCEEMGMTDYWVRAGIQPDFLSSDLDDAAFCKRHT